MSFTAYGVDGCKAGWFFISLDPSGKVGWGVVETLAKLVTKAADTDRIFVDIPIGLPYRPEGRLCDEEARLKLGPRQPSVFPAPARETLNAESYDEAKRINEEVTGKQIPRQTYEIMPKIKEVDSLLRGRAKARRIIREVHPEVCFWALTGGKPMDYNKKKREGWKERLAVLERHFPSARKEFDRILEAGHRPSGVKPDDILDAMVAAITASADSEALQTLPEKPLRDRCGLPMEIVYADDNVSGMAQLTPPQGALMAAKNFLPAWKPDETHTAKRNTLMCIKRRRAVSVTPEERVRQRILYWLVKKRKWPLSKIKLERSYDWVGDPNRDRIRSDIELLDSDGATLVVIECKAPKAPLSVAVKQQALEYAIKADSKYIWISNGDEHKFLLRSSRGTWRLTPHLKPLQTSYPPPAVNCDFPDPNNDRDIDKYLKDHKKYHDYGGLDYSDRRIVLSVHKLLFDVKKRLPFSFKGVHVLEDRGADVHEFGNAGGDKRKNRYRDFIAATSGRVEAMSVAVYTWDGENGGLRLCVGVRKANRKHHALQMDLKDCKWIESRGCWEMYHDGRMSRVSRDTVLEAVKEAGAGDWLEKEPGYLYLGDLYWVENATWINSKRFLANLLHYGIIRTNLRDALLARKKKRRRSSLTQK